MNEIELKIKEITGGNLENNVEIIRRSFQTVADELGLTRENCPAHPSFISLEQLNMLKTKGLKFFGLFVNGNQAGFVAVEKADDRLSYMEKLAVLPEYRHRGYGEKLVKYALTYIKKNGGEKISIGIIDKQKVLKDWYKKIGFQEISTKEFEHLPFTVCFMEMDISQGLQECVNV